MKVNLIIVLFIFNFYSIKEINKSNTSPDETTFTDPKNGYEIIFPDDVSIAGGSYHLPARPDNSDTDYIKISYHGERIIFGDFEEITDPIQSDSEFLKSCTEIGILSSAADGPDGGTYCKNIDSGFVKLNRFGVRYAEIYLNKFETFHDSTTNYIAGPYYFIDISGKKKKLGIYLDYRPYDGHPSVTQLNVSKKIINNIKLI